MTRYYRVLKDTPLWKEGAILINQKDNTEYHAIEDIWETVPLAGEYLSPCIIESQPEWFERVYSGAINKAIMVTKEELVKHYASNFKK